MILAGLDKYSSIMTSVATGATAIIAYMSYRHLKNRDTIKATIRQTVNENGNPTIQIANVGAIAFAVLEVGIDDMPFRYGRETFLPFRFWQSDIRLLYVAYSGKPVKRTAVDAADHYHLLQLRLVAPVEVSIDDRLLDAALFGE